MIIALISLPWPIAAKLSISGQWNLEERRFPPFQETFKKIDSSGATFVPTHNVLAQPLVSLLLNNLNILW